MLSLLTLTMLWSRQKASRSKQRNPSQHRRVRKSALRRVRSACGLDSFATVLTVNVSQSRSSNDQSVSYSVGAHECIRHLTLSSCRLIRITIQCTRDCRLQGQSSADSALNLGHDVANALS